MDTTAADIAFDDDGVCNYCQAARSRLESVLARRKSGELCFEKLVQEIRETGRNKRYDCIVGVSGGIDSSYSAYLIKKAGLRPLAVHLDNGWNSELSVKNIELLVNGLGIDLFTHVIDWSEFRDLQRSLIKASVVDIELLTDHSNFACAYHQARRRRIRHILRGKNTSSESIMPGGWTHRKRDARNIKAIHRRYGEIPIRTFPFLSYTQRNWHHSFWGIRHIRFLDYVDYDKERAARILDEELGLRPYTHKHGESTFTWFYQNYILPRKFGFDKRRSHLSALIVCGQLTRDDALKEIEKPLLTGEELRIGYDFVIRKLGFSLDEFEQYLDAAPRDHREYPSEMESYFKYRRIVALLGKTGHVAFRPFLP